VQRLDRGKACPEQPQQTAYDGVDGRTTPAWSQWLQLRVLDRLAGKTVMGVYPMHIALAQLDGTLISRAKPRRGFDSA
jgi:hypothetical protein